MGEDAVRSAGSTSDSFAIRCVPATVRASRTPTDVDRGASRRARVTVVAGARADGDSSDATATAGGRRLAQRTYPLATYGHTLVARLVWFVLGTLSQYR